ncbi:hypothetical protein QBC46DRAFT_388798 [Diplogelasinospora grovesii]|uniref:Uncharacterized protein n=1 Tax=Diplogelasinospora grovesii TaxID=303347 RepID=A0AAN6N5A9_9PEZI|nr:hypothetical protein QBC46DRAFT_388798 [Diplogelasinospora grovesii]
MAALYAVLSATMINFFADREMRTVKRSSGPCGESMEPSASVEWLSINQVLLGAELVGVSGLLGRYLQTAGGPYTPHVIAVSLGVGIVWASMHWLTRLQYRPRSARPPRPSRPPLRREASVSTIPITPTTESVPPSPTETPTTLGKRRGGGGGGLFTPRNIGLAAATGLGVMVLAAWYLDWAPEELTSVEQAFDKVRGGSSSAWWDWWMLMWKTVASWQVVLSTAAVALTPMLNQYLY